MSFSKFLKHGLQLLAPLFALASSACGVKMMNYEELELKSRELVDTDASVAVPVEFAPEPPAIVVCDPFSNGGAQDAQKGIRATLHYYESNDPRTCKERFQTGPKSPV